MDHDDGKNSAIVGTTRTRPKKYQKPRNIDMQESLTCTPVVANGVLYINTRGKLYAIGAGK